MQVHRIRIGKAHHNLAQRVTRTGLLAQQDIAGACPVDLVGRQGVTFGVEHLQVLLAQVFRVETDGWQFVLAHDGRWDGPGGVEGQPGNTRLEQRRLAFGPAYLQAGLPHRDAALVHAQLRGGHIDHDAFRLQVLGQPAEALQVDAQLFTTHRRADIEFSHGAGADHAVGLQRVAELEGFHRLDQFALVLLAVAAGQLGQVATAVQAPRQLRHPGVVHARAQQRALGDRVPMGQRLLAHAGIGIAQAAVQIGAGPRMIEGLGHVLQAGGGERQYLGIRIATGWLGVPEGLKARLLQAPVMQILQGLQVLLAVGDIAAQHVGRGIRRGQAIVGGVQAIVGKHQQLAVQGMPAFVSRP